MQSNVESHSGSPLPDEPETGSEAAGIAGEFGLDGAQVDPPGVSERLSRRLRRQAALYGPDTAKSYLASLLELESEEDDFYALADDALGVAPGSIRGLIEGIEQ